MVFRGPILQNPPAELIHLSLVFHEGLIRIPKYRFLGCEKRPSRDAGSWHVRVFMLGISYQQRK